MKGTLILIIDGALGTVTERFGKEIAGTRDQRKDEDHTNHSIVMIG